MSQLTVVIITYNEEENIGRCIDSIRDIAEEIIVVDSFSTDGTKKIAEAKGAKVIVHQFEGHIQQKNWAREQASNDYVLSVDADENLSDTAKQSIKEVKQNFSADGYTFNRLNFFCGRPIRTCGWYPDTKLRLWNRHKGEWAGINPHDKFKLNTGATMQHLKGDIMHYSFPTVESLELKADKFARISAQQFKSKPFFYLFFKMVFSPGFKFVKNYFFNLGFTSGIDGLLICYHQSREVFLKYHLAMQYKNGRV